MATAVPRSIAGARPEGMCRAGRDTRLALGVRERRTDVPNFRDHGLIVDRALLKLLRSLQRDHSYGWASERRLRIMVHEDTGHLPGVGTLPAAMRRLELLGYVQVRWIHSGGLKPDGSLASRGTLRTRVAVNRDERRTIAREARRVNRRLNVSARVTYADPVSALVETLAPAGQRYDDRWTRPSEAAEEQARFDRQKARNVAAWEAWMREHPDD